MRTLRAAPLLAVTLCLVTACDHKDEHQDDAGFDAGSTPQQDAATFTDGGSTFALSVASTGSSAGTITSSPGGIDCGLACTAQFEAGATVTLHATPSTNAAFAGWSGDCTGSGECTVTMSADRHVDARFEAPAILEVSIQGDRAGRVTSSPAGIDCGANGGSCMLQVASGTDVVLTATADPGARFRGWMNGPCSGTAPCTIRVEGHPTIAAPFDRVPSVAITVAGDGHGSVRVDPPGTTCSTGTCVIEVEGSTSATLTPIADDDSSFAGWSGLDACNGRDGACDVNVPTGGTSITARFSAWRLRLPFPPSLGGIARLGTTLIAAGDDGKVLTSEDAISWVARASATPQPLHAIAASNTAVVAVGEQGAIARTTDGLTWTAPSSGVQASLRGVAYASSIGFVAVGDAGTIVTSVDGVTWAAQRSGTVEDLLAVAASPTELLAAGYAGTILASTDGVTWSPRTSGTVQFLAAITFANGRWVAAGGAGTILTSDDGVAWTSRSSGTSAALAAIASDGTELLAVGAGQGASPSTLLASPDGASWTARSYPDPRQPLVAIAHVGATWLMIGADATILGSDDGMTWTYRVSPCSYGPIGVRDTSDLRGLVYGGSTYVGVGAFGTIVTSPDGRAWTSRHADPVGRFLHAVTYGNGLFVAAGSQGRILTSPDGVTWTEQHAEGGVDLYSATFGGGRFVLVGADLTGARGPVVRTSTDGATWNARNASVTSPLRSVTWGGGQFVAGSESDAYATSPDGLTWTPRSTGFGPLTAITYGSNTFVATSGQGGALTSSDAVHWSSHTIPALGGVAIAFGGGTFVAVANGIFTSPDGATWTLEIPIGPELLAVTHGPAGFVAGGIFKLFATHP